MADVTGSISDSSGIKDIHLNNAATEATLRLLLQSSLTGNNQLIGNIKTLAQKSGLDPNIVAAANNNLRQTTEATGALSRASHATTSVYQASSNTLRAHNQVISDSIDVMEKLTSGSGTASAVFSKFADLNTPIGLVFTGLTKLAAFQEAAMSSYQKMSASGVNFAGSLTDMRLAASKSYLTLEQFTSLMASNSKIFVNMGGSVNQGAMSFSKFTNSLISSDIGTRLLALGYNFNEINDGAAAYIAATGGRTRSEMTGAASIKALSVGTSEYLGEIDRLTQITGNNRKEQEDQLKKLSMQAAWENYIAKLRLTDPAAADKALRGLQQASQRGGEKMAQNFQAYSMGFPPMTAANAKMAGTLQNGDAALRKLVASTKDSSKSLNDISKDGAGLSYGLVQDRERLGKTGEALSLQNAESAEAMNIALKADTQARNANLKTLKDHENFVASVTTAQEAREKSQADTAAKAQKAMNEMGQLIMTALTPAIITLLPVVNFLIDMSVKLVKVLTDFKEVTVGVIAALIAYKALQVKAAVTAGGGVRGALSAVMGGSGLGALGSMNNPMYVRIVGSIPGGGAPGGVEDLLERQKKAKAAIKPGAPGSTRAARLAAVEAGRAAQATSAASTAAAAAASTAAQGAKSILSKAGIIGTLAAGAMAIPTWMDINEKVKKEGLSEEDANKQKGGLVGEIAGGASGAALGAGIGAALGTAIIPVVGTAIGGLIGGLIGLGGGFLGASYGKSLGETYIAPKLAEGAIITRPTMAMVGEGKEAEAVMPLSKLSDMLKTNSTQQMQETIKTVTSELVKPKDKSSETLQTSIETLNKNITEMLRYVRDTADHTKRTYEATRSLNGNVWAR